MGRLILFILSIIFIDSFIILLCVISIISSNSLHIIFAKHNILFISRFIIDEEMRNYQEIYDWMKDNTEKYEVADMILSVMSSHNTVNKQFQFKNASKIMTNS